MTPTIEGFQELRDGYVQLQLRAAFDVLDELKGDARTRAIPVIDALRKAGVGITPQAQES